MDTMYQFSMVSATVQGRAESVGGFPLCGLSCQTLQLVNEVGSCLRSCCASEGDSFMEGVACVVSRSLPVALSCEGNGRK